MGEIVYAIAEMTELNSEANFPKSGRVNEG